MADLDRWLSRLGADADYSVEAIDRLSAELALHPSPAAEARRRTRLLSGACVALGCIVGAGIGAAAEFSQPATTGALLPASSTSSPASLLFGGVS